MADDRGVVKVSLQFEVDEQRRPLIKGQVSTTIDMICERCLDVAEIDVVAPVSVAVVRNEEQAGNLPADLDPLIVEEEAVELLPFIEQEILLCMPGFAYHENETCHSGQEAYSTMPEGSAEELEPEPQRPNPFSVLAGLKAGK
ncbi:YceD family protein [Parendozoicomonas haliclonae]|uniref:YceD family protein n=1 Tax=Parendozoicomonas haliclonae TaxID=1960125 RepID=UPI0013FDE89C|nr:YceD family protein [Parendozoicomonas haliclonae]